jgi:ATP-dependent RNA helicase RhlE
LLFSELNIIEPILKTLVEEGYENPTAIQEKAIPVLLDRKDILACAQTGTGKTAAFSIPILQLMYGEKPTNPGRHIKALILTPTRELAIQIKDSIQTYGKGLKISNTVVFGGVGQNPQVEAILRGVDILIATPGRLLDLMNQGHINLSQVKYFVLDEADRMLDMGFLNDVKKVIAKIPVKRHTLFFSATMPTEILGLANSILYKPVSITVTPVSSTANTIKQKVYFLDKGDKKNLLRDLIAKENMQSVLVFSRTKHGANRIVKELQAMKISAEAIHGNKSQSARQLALSNFKAKKTKVLVATDIAARGIDIDELKFVINYDLPNVSETYVHRIGRTGRAGNEGTAFSMVDATDFPLLKDIEKLINKPIPLETNHPYHVELNHNLAKIAVREKLAKAAAEPRRPNPRMNPHEKKRQIEAGTFKPRSESSTSSSSSSSADRPKKNSFFKQRKKSFGAV